MVKGYRSSDSKHGDAVCIFLIYNGLIRLWSRNPKEVLTENVVYDVGAYKFAMFKYLKILIWKEQFYYF